MIVLHRTVRTRAQSTAKRAARVVPALEPGTYYFRCDLHPEMNGELVVQG